MLDVVVNFTLWSFFRGGAVPSGEIVEGVYIVHGYGGSPTQVSASWESRGLIQKQSAAEL